MDFSIICRTCLGTQYLRPIFNENVEFNSCSTVIFIATGLRINKDDGLPQQMCNTCTTLLNESLKFREICKDVENKLLALKNIKEDNSINVHLIKQRKNSNKYEKNGMKIEIVQEVFVNEDDLPLNQLISSQNVKKPNNAKLETIALENVFTKEEINKEFDLEVKSDSESNIDTHEEYKYETEFLDFNIDSNSDTEEFLSKENQFISDDHILKEENVMKEDIVISVNTDTSIKKREFKVSRHRTKNSNSILKITKEKKRKHNIIVLKNIESDDNNKLNIENIPFTINNSKNITCKICQKELTQTCINTHLAKNHPEAISDVNEKIEFKIEDMPFTINNLNRVTCNICQKDLSRRSIDTHLAKKHPGEDVRKVKCDLCDVFVTRQRLQKHKETRHGLDCLRCAYCKNEFDTKELLLDHVSSCTFKNRKRNLYASKKRKELMVECDICHKSMQKASLKTHKDIKHAGMRPICEHCGRTFGNKFRFMEHLRAKHEHDKFQCSMCGFKSASTMSLRNHERRHRGEKPFVCSQCGASFHARYLLAQHTHSHRTRRDMKCDQCPAAFKANNSLHMHKMTCHNNNVYQCALCPRVCKSRAILSRHVRTVHRNNAADSTLTADAV